MAKNKLLTSCLMLSTIAPILIPLQGFAWGTVNWLNDSEYVFNNGAKRDYYGDSVMRLKEYKGVTFFGPKNNDYGSILENDKKDGGWMTDASRALLVDAGRPYIGYKNFKRGECPINDGSYRYLSKDTGIFNEYGFAKGYTGNWRYLGYTSAGNVINNPYFPSDLGSGRYWRDSDNDYDKSQIYPWSFDRDDFDLNPSGGNNEFIDPSTFDNKNNIALWEQKKSVIRECIKKFPGMAKVSSDVDWWADRLSLQTDPTKNTPILALSLKGYIRYRTITLPYYDETINLNLSKINVYDKNGNVVVTWSRGAGTANYDNRKLIKGEQYTVKYYVENPSNKNTTISPSVLNFSNAYGESATSNKDMNVEHMPGAIGFGAIQSSGVINAHTTKVFEKTFTIPQSAEGKFRFGAIIPDTYYKHRENLEADDDWGRVIVDIANGDLVAEKAQLYDMTNGREVEYCVPEYKYKIRYKLKYKGDNIDHPCNIIIHANINRKLPKYRDDTTNWVTYTKKVDSLKDGQEIVIESESFVAPIDNVNTDFYIDSDMKKLGIDNNLQNDANNNAWKGNYDLVIHDARVLPPTEIISKKGDYSFTIQYKITNNAPYYLGVYDRDVKVKYVVNGQTFEDTVHIEKGASEYITKTVTLKDLDPANVDKVKAKIIINSDGYNYEDNYNNNTAIVNNNLVTPMNPYNGGICPAGVNTHNKWVRNYYVHSWQGWEGTNVAPPQGHDEYTNQQYEAVKRFVKNAPGRYYVNSTKQYEDFKYYHTGYSKNISREEYENYSIRSVKFRSKYTKDHKLGNDGWVDITNGENGKIKAGYGFELEVKVNYNTNALQYENELKPWVQGAFGRTVRPLNGKPNLPDELFIKTPDNKIISFSGYQNTIAGLNESKDGNVNNMTWTYTLKPQKVLDDKMDNKIFIGDDTKNGVYTFDVYTPEVYGVQTKQHESWLCDHKPIHIEVVGSDTSDVVNHITQ